MIEQACRQNIRNYVSLDSRSEAIFLDKLRSLISIEPAKEQFILDCFEQKEYSKKELILKNGSISRHEYFIIEGCMRMFVLDKAGLEHTLSICVEGWWCGDIKSFTQQESAWLNIQALEKTTVLQISRKDWDKMITSIPETERWFRLGFQHGLIAQQERIIQNISNTAEERYQSYAKRYPQIIERVPQKHIASYLGITPEFLSMLKKRGVQ